MRTFVILLFGVITFRLHAADYAREVADFQAARERSISSAEGWSTVVGLAWLKEGLNRVGSDPDSEVAIPSSVPARVGTIILKGKNAEFRPAPGIKIPAQELKEDTTILSVGSGKFFLIGRDNRFAIRV